MILSAMLVGAVIGAAVGGISSIVTQSICGNGKINWWQVGLDAFMGGISGALGASPITKTTSMILGGVLGAAGSLGGTIIGAKGDFSSINWGTAIASAIFMGAIGAVLGHWTGDGATNFKVMTDRINAGKSWGSKAFLTSVNEVMARPNSGLTIQTMYMNMHKAIVKYKIKAMGKVYVATAGSTVIGNRWEELLWFIGVSEY